ncbi:lipoprotein cytochrome c [Thermotomaculum hydrothermale]|uniref:Lipoprotein cytochrome c n=1 Tax=Thermotomaculum hydrothermale TaxID=981385 RepID=A0A7R6PPN5_9BACT|nr:GSU2203 family decaheme c-type cytochrome [Thermotomaculum hydrothermale]BBB33533.1 lipoprotein cytochrome c [Thermotomaculum hydrothermale]
MKVRWLPILLAFMVFFAASSLTLKAQEKDMPQYVGSEACADCHEEIYDSFKFTAHGMLTNTNSKEFASCESCHGPGSIHIETNEVKDIYSFRKLSPEKVSSICLKCHLDTDFADWPHTEHFKNGVSCTACHKIHTKRGNYGLKKEGDKLCYSCHMDIKAKFNLPSHHPVKENKMSCLDCHNPHGGEEYNLKTSERKNDLCFKCHADKQGPFTYEHAPVVEDCTICHDPHGTLVNNLLKKTEPFLCLQCHHVHFQIREHLDVRGIASSACTHCHPAIHGTDFPSTLKTNGGSALTR